MGDIYKCIHIQYIQMYLGFQTSKTCHNSGGVNIPVLAGQIFRDLLRFIPVYSGYSGTFSKGIVWAQVPIS